MLRFALIACGLLACAPSQGSLRGPVDGELARRLGRDVTLADPAATAKIAERLARPLDLDGAVRIALANNARIRAALAELEIAGGGLAVVLGPTTVELSLRQSETELSVVQELVGLLVAPRQRATARAEVAAARADAAMVALRLAGRVERAHNNLLAAIQGEELRRTAFDAADAAALLRERMHDAGNTSDLALARDRAAREDARVELGRAQAAVEQQREVLNGLLGLTGDQTKWTVAGQLPELPTTAPALDGLEATAVSASLELVAGRARIDAARGQLSRERLRSVLPHVGIGVSVAEHTDHSVTEYLKGPVFELGLPLFDWNSGGRARARGAERKAVHELAAAAIELRAGARAARIAALASYAEARHLRDVVLPLRQQVVDQTVLHYNAMDADPFALILARQQLAESGARYLDALRRFANAMAGVRGLERGVLLDMVEAGPPGRMLDPGANEALH